jgi:hypothetical protein
LTWINCTAKEEERDPQGKWYRCRGPLVEQVAQREARALIQVKPTAVDTSAAGPTASRFDYTA